MRTFAATSCQNRTVPRPNKRSLCAGPENGFVRDDKAAAGLDELSRRTKAEEVFMDMLSSRMRQGAGEVSSGCGVMVRLMRQRFFAKHPENKDGFSEKEFAHAMEILLLGVRKIEIGMSEEGPPSKRKSSTEVREAS